MPVLHKYRSREGYYVRAGVNGRIVTYRLSTDGELRLKESSTTSVMLFNRIIWKYLFRF